MTGGDDRVWTGFADFSEVSSDLRETLNEAVRAGSHLIARRTQGVACTPATLQRVDQALLVAGSRFAAEPRLSSDAPGPAVEAGRRLREEHLPSLDEGGSMALSVEQLDRFLQDLVCVAWEMNLVRAGRFRPADPGADEEQVSKMFE